MAAADDVQTAINNVASQLADMTASPKPSYSVGGRSFSWGEHFNNLTDKLETLQKALVFLQGSFEVRSRAY